MWPLLIGAVAASAGILLGFWLRGNAAKAELAAAKGELAQSKAESAARAGFESLAAERGKRAGELAAEIEALRAQLAAKTDESATLAASVAELKARLESERKNLAEKLALLETAKKTLADQFQALAGEIIDQKTKTFAEGSQKELGTLLNPLKTQIEEFRKKVEEAQSDSKVGVAELKGLVGALAEQSRQMGEKADHLTTALRGSAKAQGDWGEFILRDLLEKAGLREGEQFSFQQSFAGVENEAGGRTKTARTDVVVFLPGGRDLVVDSKVSLNAYTEYANAADEAGRAAALKQHLASVRAHVAGLAKAGYQRLPGLETPDFVVMFVPVEPAFLLALQQDSALWADAYREGILLVGPTTLLYIIRIVNVLWQQELQARNVKEVMERGSALYDKFVNFVADLEAVGRSLRSADQCFGDAMKKLSTGSGNLVRQVEMLKELGVRSKKSLPQTLLDGAGVAEPALLPAEEREKAERG